MRTLYHMFLSPFSRKVRLALREKGLDFEMRFEKTWERRPEFLALNPAAQVPVLVEDDGSVICDSAVICEYLEEAYPDAPKLLPDTAKERAETRRLTQWFDQKFAREVTVNLVGEKLMKRFLGRGEPNSSAIRAGKVNVKTHLDYIAYLTERRNWLAGERLTLADIAAAAQLSCVDYLGDVPWEDHQPAKDWYARVKSRPAFRPLLADNIPGAPPPTHYADLDF